MKLSQEAIQAILGIKDRVSMTPENMAKNLNITFFPPLKTTNPELLKFRLMLENALKELGVNVLPYEETLEETEKGKKIKKGIAIIATGDCEVGNHPVDNTTSFTRNPLISILPMPEDIDWSSSFEKHFQTIFKLCLWHISSILICVDKEKWLTYNANGSHVFHDYNDFKENVSKTLISKIAAPIRPPRISDFLINRVKMNFKEKEHLPFVKDFVESNINFGLTKMYPPRVILRKMKFKNAFYRWVASIWMDRRTGMSYGFLARQLPVKLETPLLLSKVKEQINLKDLGGKDFFMHEDKIFIVFDWANETYALKVPDVWVMTARSGSKKTNLRFKKDIIKMGLINGHMVMEIPRRLKLKDDYKPSFDTKVILSHAISNAIYASILAFFKKDAVFPKTLSNNGMSLVHWHGYLLPGYIPRGWKVYGESNLPVSCSAPQAAIYAFQGKEKAIMDSLADGHEYLGDIHIEPHHGTNINWPTLNGLTHYLLSSHDVSKLGNEYLEYYH